jgi:archaellum biogenesis protein FlaJ (TadC family)
LPAGDKNFASTAAEDVFEFITVRIIFGHGSGMDITFIVEILVFVVEILVIVLILISLPQAGVQHRGGQPAHSEAG